MLFWLRELGGVSVPQQSNDGDIYRVRYINMKLILPEWWVGGSRWCSPHIKYRVRYINMKLILPEWWVGGSRWCSPHIKTPRKYPWWGSTNRDLLQRHLNSDSLSAMVPVWITFQIWHKQQCLREWTNNYLSTPLFGSGTEMTTSRLDQTGHTVTSTAS